MVKSYLKFEPARSFGVVASGTSNLLWAGHSSTSFTSTSAASTTTGSGHAIVAANEDVLVWDMKKGELLSRWHDDKNTSQVTALAASRADRDVVAVGYEDGSVRLWDRRMATVMVNFNGHRSAVTHLAFDGAGVRLASGSKDTDVIVWDLVAETGLYKLRGHKDQITGLAFAEPSLPVGGDGEDEGDGADVVADTPAGDGFLITTSKDSLIKLWDLSSRHCIETHVAQTNGECWALGVSADLSGCVTAGNDGELQVWTLDAAGLAASTQQVDALATTKSTTNAEPTSPQTFLTSRGTLHRHGKDRTVEILFHPRHDFFAVHGVEKAVEIWRIRSDAEIKRALVRKRRRRRERQGKVEKGADTNVDAEDDESLIDTSQADVGEIFVQHVIVRTGGKVRSVDWAAGAAPGGGSKKDLQMLVGTTNNLLELYTVSTKKDRVSKQAKKDKEEPPEYGRALAVELPGHRTDVRSISLSSDDKMLATAANGSLKIWNVRTQSCIRTFECGYALCCAFLPGDKVVLVGTKTGALELFDVASAALLETVENAHDNGAAIWSLQVHPDGRSVVTGSADKTVKFWDFRIVQEPVLGTTRTTPRLKLVQTRLLKLTDDVLSVRFSPDARLLAVALLDNTVKVFFVDSLKLYLNLYGHKLPVLSMDISYDSKLIVTSSADKNVKIWGLDFGDCHRSLFAHQDSILQVAFVPHNQDGNGHHFFSCGKDRAVKYWDGDKFEQIQRLDGHFGEIWALAVSHGGRFVVTASHDKSIRVWDETDEQIFLEEEREREIEQLYESTLATSLDRADADEDPEERDREGQLGQQVGAASKQTVETLMAGERIAEALELGLADLNLLKEWDEAKARALAGEGGGGSIAPPQRHIVFVAQGNLSAEQYVLGVLAKIPAAALHDALLVLPFAQVPALFTFLERFARQGLNMPLTCRVLFFMLKTHHRQIVASRTMRAMLDTLRASLRGALQQQKDQMGHNMAALRVVGSAVADQSVKTYVDDTWDAAEAAAAATGAGKRKRTFVQVA
ncbi:U3 small nucleolar RNA-associated protein 12 [Sporothrix schenckii 1099-18]|uniref:U3 small nucleolar RNA-associated protein 12 n=1 Tax=Sporothrix schenckii 1099-18 TaxID=1397361 RepID=A0A0F2LW16_SPOSC|nr:U3 small nucleolar RNA-associated protein 12 [Sporothrix schenckii 1099-18]KJR81648.1 U3 small nucleolar RNA-associated protein 12 [Sporothrix schenckii 1099-18]